MSFANDIPTSVAYAAHSGTSFVPDRRAQSERDDYAATLKADYDSLAVYADTEEKQALLDEEFARYRAGYRAKTLKYLQSRGGLVSWMIAGPSRFPVARMEKRGNVVHTRLEELLDFRRRALAAITKKLRPELRPIMSGDADAVERLEEKIVKAERVQEAMKKANQIVRSKPKNQETPEKLVALMEIGIAASRAKELFEPDYCGRLGFPGYALTNNNANIRRIKERLESISRAQSQEATEVKSDSGITFEENPAENRVRLFFPGKPSAEIRTKLKSSGFRWTPSLGCWQAYCNYRNVQAAKEIAGVA